MRPEAGNSQYAAECDICSRDRWHAAAGGGGCGVHAEGRWRVSSDRAVGTVEPQRAGCLGRVGEMLGGAGHGNDIPMKNRGQTPVGIGMHRKPLAIRVALLPYL